MFGIGGKNTIQKQIKKEITDFHEPIHIVPGYEFNHRYRVDSNYRLYLGKYLSGEYEQDSEGKQSYKKWFRNIVRSPVNTARKEMNFDTKDIRILAKGSSSRNLAWLFERGLNQYMEDVDFGSNINDLTFQLPIQGTAVWKFINNKPYEVDLRNFIVEPNAETLEDARYVIQRYVYNIRTFLKDAKEFGWESDKIVEKARQRDMKTDIVVYERYGEMPNSDIEDVPEDEGYSYSRTYVATLEDDESTSKTIGESVPSQMATLKCEKIDDLPYEEFHLEKIPGRWLGVSIPEMIAENQMRINELANLKAKASYWAALQIFQTRDPNMASNLMDYARNGQVFHTTQELRPIDTRERNLQSYMQEEQAWLNNRDEVTFSYEQMRGEPLPARTPLGATEMAYGASKQYYELLRQNVALRMKKLIRERIIPDFRNSYLDEETIVKLVGEDIEFIEDDLATKRAEKRFFEEMMKDGILPTSQEMQSFKEIERNKIRKKGEIELALDDMFDDFEYDIKVTITGESEDIRAKQQSLRMLAEMYMANPQAVQQDETLRKMMGDLAEGSGINLKEYFKQDEARQAQQQMPEGLEQALQGMGRSGGGITRPNQTQQPQRGEVEERV